MRPTLCSRSWTRTPSGFRASTSCKFVPNIATNYDSATDNIILQDHIIVTLKCFIDCDLNSLMIMKKRFYSAEAHQLYCIFFIVIPILSNIKWVRSWTDSSFKPFLKLDSIKMCAPIFKFIVLASISL